MPITDTPLKVAFRGLAPEFAAWLLGVREVAAVFLEDVELPASARRADTVYRVTLPDGRQTLLHLEFQGHGSERSMPIRMLEYMSRLSARDAGREPLPLTSVVLYIGEGTGRDDEGEHQILSLDGQPALTWRYRVLRLWEMEPEELLAQDRPALLTLVGFTHLEAGEAAEVLPEVVKRISQIEDSGQRQRIITLLMSLLMDEELIQMVESVVKEIGGELYIDSPYLRRIRAEGRAEGVEQGIERGLRRATLNAVLARFDLSMSAYERIERQLEAINDDDLLDELHQAAIRAETLEAFEETLAAQTA